MKCWNVWAVFHGSNGIRTNLKSPNGVMTVVLGMSKGYPGIWWYAWIRSSFEKIVALCNMAVDSWICGIGYLSGIVGLFNARLSPAVYLGTIWRAEAQLFDDSLTILTSSMCWNSCLAIFNHSMAKHQGLAHTGGPLVQYCGLCCALFGHSCCRDS